VSTGFRPYLHLLTAESGNAVFDFGQMRLNVMINHFNGGAVLTDTFIARIPAEPEPCAVPHAKRNNGAVFALLRPVGLQPGKGGSPGAVHQRRKPALQQIADFPLFEYEKVAGIAVRVVLDDEIAGAGFLITARGLDSVDKIQKQVFEKPDGHIIEVLFEPCIEQLDIEFACFFRANGKGHQLTRLRVRFKTMDELKEFKTLA